LFYGSYNIYRIAKNAINGIERPKYLCRKKKEDNVKVEKHKKEKVKKVVPDFSKSSKDLKVRQKKVTKSVKVDALTKS
jgi:hypothetical protein